MRSIRTSTYSSVRAFRLQELLSRSKSIRSVRVHVDEVALSHQLQWAFGGKISMVSLTGPHLRHVAADAFKGLHPHGPIMFRLSRCPALETLPIELLHHLGSLPRVSVDLSGNPRLSGFTAQSDDVYETTGDKERLSHYVTGSLKLGGTPWICDCKLLWFKHRLERQRRHLTQGRGNVHPAESWDDEPRCVVFGTNHVRITELEPGSAYCAGGGSIGSSSGHGVPLLRTIVVWLLVASAKYGSGLA